VPQFVDKISMVHDSWNSRHCKVRNQFSFNW